MNLVQFDKQKEASLSGIDLSRKGSVDLPITDLVQFINGLDDYFTTSSCSGRIIVFQKEDENQKKGCKWLYTSHEEAQFKPVIDSLMESSGNAVFKFEPFVLHVQCRSLEHAQKLHAVGVASGFRNSGITVGNKGKIITAIRSTQSLEVPISNQGHILVSNQYIEYLVQCANEKLQENFIRIKRFFDNFKELINTPDKQIIKARDKEIIKKLKQENDKINNDARKQKLEDQDDLDEDTDLNLFCFDKT